MSEEITGAVARLGNRQHDPLKQDVATVLNFWLSNLCKTENLQYTPAITGVYGLFLGDELVYVGQSREIFRRVKSHRSHKREGGVYMQFDSYAYIETETVLESRVAERRILRRILPAENSPSKSGVRANWGWVVLDDLAEVLGLSVADLAVACDEAKVPAQHSTHDLLQALTVIRHKKLYPKC